VVVTGFTARVVQKGREASEALNRLRDMAPMAASKAKEETEAGNFEEALRIASYAVQLQPENRAFRMARADVLQLMGSWEEALREYARCTGEPGVELALQLMQELLAMPEKEKAQAKLYEALLKSGRQGESVAYAKALGEGFWKKHGEALLEGAKQEKEAIRLSKRDPSVIGELVKRLEEKLLPVPGTEVLMSKTELTVGEWKLYRRAEGYLTPEGQPDWQQPDKDWEQTDEHPVVLVSWNQAKEFCDWLTAKTGKHWRMPTNAEWEAAAGRTKYPWGEYFPPQWNDGNYAILSDGKTDPQRVGVDGIKGTAPVGSFKPNALGFYDLGGNVSEWMWDGVEEKTGKWVFRGGSWDSRAENCAVAYRYYYFPGNRNYLSNGCRVALSSVP
jgi:formylglycine-generating enzyme required for sulfatase activity